MPAVLIGNPKGGVGKTTLALNLAFCLGQRGQTVRLWDVDSQQSLWDWVQRRPAALTPLSCQKCSPAQMMTLPDDAGVIDLFDLPAGFPEQSLLQFCKDRKTVVLMPTSVSPVDVDALTHHLFRLVSLGIRELPDVDLGLIINRARSRLKLHRDTMSWLSKIAIDQVAEIRETVNYALPAREGLSAMELPERFIVKDKPVWDAISRWVLQRLALSLPPEAPSRAD